MALIATLSTSSSSGDRRRSGANDWAAVIMEPRFSQAFERRNFAPSHKELGFFVIFISGFCCTDAKTPGIGLFAYLFVLNRLLAIESSGLPQNTPFPLMLNISENSEFLPVVISFATSYRTT